MAEERTVSLKVRRQDGPGEPPRWEEFVVPLRPRMNVIGALMEIQRNPVTKDGTKVAPVVWESSCLEEVCGACSMLVNGRARQSCAALIEQVSPKGEVVVLEPLSKFPIVRDLVVDRSRMFDDLKRVKAWISLDGTHALGPAPRQSPAEQETAYPLSRCMTCGCCLEACPQVGPHSAFVGPAAISQVRLFNMHPSGKLSAKERLEALMGEGGIEDCGKAQNCVTACPKEIPLVDSIAKVSGDTTKHLLRNWLFGG